MNHLEFHFEVNTLDSKIKKNLLNRLYSNVKGSKKKSFLQQTIVCLNLIYVIVLLRFSLSSLILNLNRRQMQNLFFCITLMMTRGFKRLLCQWRIPHQPNIMLHNLINIFTGKWCCNRQHHGQTIHPTKNFILMNWFKFFSL